MGKTIAIKDIEIAITEISKIEKTTITPGSL